MALVRPGNVPLELRSESGMVVNLGPGTVYFGDDQHVDADNFEGQLGLNQTVPIQGTLWFIGGPAQIEVQNVEPQPEITSVSTPALISGEGSRLYRVASARLRNDGSPGYWQPVSDTSDRPQNVGAVTTTPVTVTIKHPIEGVRAGTTLAEVDDVLRKAGIGVAARRTADATELTFIQSAPISDLVTWNGTGWTFSKGATSPFTLAGATAVQHDVSTQTAEYATATVQNTTHTPVGTPKGVLVRIVQNSVTTDEVTGVTYGGVVMTRVRKQDRSGSSLELGTVYLYFLGASVPTGAQTVAITSSGTSAKRAVISTVTADAAGTVVDINAGASAASGADPQLALTFSGNLTDAMVYYAIATGLAVPVTTTQAGTTNEFTNDFGQAGAMWARKAVPNGASTTIGYVAASDDWVQAAVVIKASNPVAFPNGILRLTHADIGAQDPTSVTLTSRGGTYRAAIAAAGTGVNSTEVNIEFYNSAGTKQTVGATGMDVVISRPAAPRTVDPQTITTVAYPNADVTVYGLFEVDTVTPPDPTDPGSGGGVPTDPGSKPADTALPAGGVGAKAARVTELSQYKAGWFSATAFQKRQLPAGARTLFQHATQPLANSANWVASLCTQMGFDPATPQANLIPDYLPGHTDGMAWIRREGDMIYIVPADQPKRPIANINAGVDTWASRMQAVIDVLGGLPVPYDVEGTNNPDRNVHVYQPSTDIFVQMYLAASTTVATTTLSLAGTPQPSIGTFNMLIDYGDNILGQSTFTTQTAIPWNATASQVKASVDGARNALGQTLASGNAGRCVASGGPLNSAPIVLSFAIATPLKPVWMRMGANTLDQGSIAFAHVNAGPYDRCRGGSVITPGGGVQGVSVHPAVYRDRLVAGFYWEDFRWGGAATSIEYMSLVPSWDEVRAAQDAGTGLDHAIPLVVGHAQLNPVGWVAPALRSDGDKASNPGYIAEGSRIAFPNNVDLSYVQANYPEIMWLALTLRDYGCVVYDKTGAGCEFVFRRASWADTPAFNPWFDLLPLYAATGSAPHRYMRALPWHKAQIIDPAFSA